MSDVVCFSALPLERSLDSLQALPPHLMRYRRVFFVEEARTSPHVEREQLVTWEWEGFSAPIIVVSFVLPGEDSRRIPFENAGVQPRYARQLREFLVRSRATDLLCWLNTYRASAYVDSIPHRLLVYAVDYPIDAAPRERCDDENALIRRANLVVYRKYSAEEARV